jgi:predicted acylesterase/phospholipase RssA
MRQPYPHRDAAGRGRAAAVLLGCALLAAGCASALAINVPRAGPISCVHPTPDPAMLVGVALSGGGSRAALFAAAGLEALGRMRVPDGGSLLERVGYVSSVSGGSVAGAYYASQKPTRGVPVLALHGGLSDDYQAFFARFRRVVTQDIEGAMIRRQLTTFRWLNSSLAARSLAEVLVERVLGDIRFRGLAVREVQGDSPRLIVNTTLFNNGRRLVFTTLPPDAMRYDFFQALRESLARRGVTPDIPIPLVRRWETLLPVTLQDLHIDPCDIRLAAAVAGSASFPPLIGPVTFWVGDEEQYWHTGDGGLYENQGLESILFTFLRKLQEGTARRALIIAFDSSYPFSVGSRRLALRAEPFSLFSYDFSRIPSIMEERATAYQALFFKSLQFEGVFPDPRTARIVVMRHTEAEWQTDLGDLPEACRAERPPLTTVQAVQERIAEIPTRFRLPSECDRQLLVTAAAKVVAQKEPELQDFLTAD